MIDSTRPSIISVENIESRFGQTYLHRGISFKVDRPSIVALIGESGCGKSVLLREIVGLFKPLAGSISVLGTPIWSSSAQQLAAVKSRMGVLFQNGALFSALTVGQNVAAPMREQADLPQDLIAGLVHLRLALSGLPETVATKMPSQLSGGMRKRVALARALALEPEILLLDEPTAGLDPINARAFDRLIRTLCDSLKLTVLLVTHDLDTLKGIVDRIIVLSGGKVLADGSLNEVASIKHDWIQAYFSATGENLRSAF